MESFLPYFILIIAIFGCIFCPFWIARPKNNKDRFYGVFSLFGSILMLCISIFIISYNNDILFFSQKKENINVVIDIDTSIVEDSSVLYFFNEDINHKINSNDIEILLGYDFEEHSETGYYSMIYTTSQYTLNNIKSDYISAEFNKSGDSGKVRSVTWSYGQSDSQLYYELLDYLTEYVLGKPKSKETTSFGTLTADWSGYHLECNKYRIIFQRNFN